MCRLREQGIEPGSCKIDDNGILKPACETTLKSEDNRLLRLITSIHLSRPENYLSIYQSGCNFSCRKCHSWYFSQKKDGKWYSAEDILNECIKYEKKLTLYEPREHATAWHAHESCRCCGYCQLTDGSSSYCPNVLSKDDILLSPQGFGPARNIVAFTGGDITCQPEFYAECTTLIKQHTSLWVLIETNGYGLTGTTLDILKTAGVDAFWLDIKAYDEQVHLWLTGCSNQRILKLPAEIIKRQFVLEILSLYIPTVVEVDQIEMISHVIADVDKTIPFTILAFFPEYLMKTYRTPDVDEMIHAYNCAKQAGLENIRLGNTGVFAKTEADYKKLATEIGIGNY